MKACWNFHLLPRTEVFMVRFKKTKSLAERLFGYFNDLNELFCVISNMMNVMKTTADLDSAIAASHDQPIVIFKHSATCPFSAMAQAEMANAKHDLEIHCLVVQYVPELSAAVEQKLEVEHASPQAIIVSEGKAHGKYWRSEIKEYRIKDAIKELKKN